IGRRTLEPPMLAKVEEVLDKANAINLISDCFYATPAMWMSAVNDKPVGQALSTIARPAAHVWRLESGFVLVRARRYAYERCSEPPISMLRKWSKLTPEQAQDIDVLSEIADQPYAAYQTTI